MKITAPYRVIKRLAELDKIFTAQAIPFEFNLCYSKTEGHIIKVYSDSSTDFQTIIIWPVYKDLYLLARIITEEMKKQD
jgi:hypothetical protein